MTIRGVSSLFLTLLFTGCGLAKISNAPVIDGSSTSSTAAANAVAAALPDSGVGGVYQPTFTNVMKVLNTNCLSCHGVNGNQSFQMNSYASVMLDVTASSPDASTIVISTKTAPSAPKMPKAPGSALNTADQQLIYDWIAAGALNN